MIPIVLAAVAAYLLGSIPFGYLAGLSRGIDIRTAGSGNIGATNVFRVFGKKLGMATLLLDVFKGIAAVAVIPMCVWYVLSLGGAPPLAIEMLCAVCVLVGHALPVFLNFRGGKGVATGLGIIIGVAPWTALLGIGVWVVLFLLTRYVSVGSIGAAVAAIVAVWLLDNAREPQYLVPTIVSVLSVFVIIKHHSNIGRLIQGTENRFRFGSKHAGRPSAKK